MISDNRGGGEDTSSGPTTTQEQEGEFKPDPVYILRSIEIAQSAREHGNHPFGALLVADDGQVLAEAENTVETERDATGHAETNLVRLACKSLSPEVIHRSTLYTSTEPCAMCSGAIYWSGIPRVVYALPEDQLAELTGSDERNLTMSLPCREVFGRGQRKVVVMGPYEIEKAREVHQGAWK